MRYKLRDETEWLLDGDTAHQVDNVVVVTFRNLLHHLYLSEKVRMLLPGGRIYDNREKMLICPCTSQYTRSIAKALIDSNYAFCANGRSVKLMKF